MFLSRDQVFDPATDTFLGQTTVFREELVDVTDQGAASFQRYVKTLAFTVPRQVSPVRFTCLWRLTGTTRSRISRRGR